MTSIQPALPEDWGAWRELDRHVCRAGFLAAVRRSMAWWVLEEGQPVGVLRYQLFWEQIPFLNLLFLKASARRQGHGRAAMALWEAEMSRAGSWVTGTAAACCWTSPATGNRRSCFCARSCPGAEGIKEPLLSHNMAERSG